MSHQGYKNNGVLVLVSTGDRRVEVEIGQGLNHVFNREEWLQHMIHSRMTLGQADTFGDWRMFPLAVEQFGFGRACFHCLSEKACFG